MQSQPQILLTLVLLSPFISFALNALIPPLRKNRHLSPGLSIIAVLISTLSSVVLLKINPRAEFIFEWIPLNIFSKIEFGFFTDPVVLIMFFIVSLVSLVVQVYSLGYMSEESPPSLGRYYTFHSLFAFSMLGFVASLNLLQIYIFWELVGLCSYLLIGFWYTRPEASRAAVKAFWVTRFGDVGFAIGMVLLWGATGTFFLPELFAKAPDVSKQLITVCMFLILFGAMGKSAQFPLHVWLPDAMEGPTPVSALIHAATMVVAGIYLVLRLFPLFELTPDVLVFALWIGSITSLLGASLALVQNDIKRILAYSTVSQIGYMFAALGAGAQGISFFHLFTHAFFKSLLFLGAGCIIHALHTNNIWEMGKLGKRMPHIAILFLIGSLSLSGIFPFSGHFSKDEILMWMHVKGLDIHFLILLITAFLTAFYMFRAFFVVFFGDRESSATKIRKTPWIMSLPMWILAILTVFAGFGASKFFGFLGYRLEQYHARLEYLPLIASISGIALAWSFYQVGYLSPALIYSRLSPFALALERKFWIDDIYTWIYRNILDGLSSLCGWFDRYIVDGFVNLIAYSAKLTSERLRTMQTGRTQDYLYGIIIAIVLFFILSLITPHIGKTLTDKHGYNETQRPTIIKGWEQYDD
ncbi:MAG: NADH-quinone oxidoreductase subunit L [Thermodesulfobacteriota bacterium]